MKSRAAVILVLMLSLSLIPALQVGFVRAQSQSGYSERLDVYTAGSNALWFMTFRGINATAGSFASAESVQGLNAYRITAIKTSGITPDLQVFTSDGYGILKLPFLPLEGVFLTVNATSRSAADAAASAFDAYLTAAFVPVSSGVGTFTYFSSVSFDSAAAPVLYKLVPASLKGMASMISESSFLGLSLPMLTLEGARSGSSFVHTLQIGAASAGVLDSAGNLAMSSVLKLSNSTVTTSLDSSSSAIYVHSLDGLVSSTDLAVTSNHQANFSGSYVLTVRPGNKVTANVSILSQIPNIEVYRTLDRGSVGPGDVLSVTMLVRAVSTVGLVQNVLLNDSWWKSYPSIFQLGSTNSTFKIPSLTPGQNASRTYVLKVLSGGSGNGSDIILPPLKVTYTVNQQGRVLSGSTTTNQAEVRVGQHGPALSIIAHSRVLTGSPLGTDGRFSVAVTNTGDGPALNLKIGNYTSQSLAPGGNTWTVGVPISMTSLLDRNISRAFDVQWSTPAGQGESLSSNKVSLLLSHSNMNIPLVLAVANATVTSDEISKGSLSATYTFENRGNANASSVSASLSLPTGLTCEKVSQGPGTCSGSAFVATFASLSNSRPETSVLTLGLGRDNYELRPTNVTFSYMGISLQSWGSPLALPAGVVITKSFNPNRTFQGMSSTVTLGFSNEGSLPLYNLTLSSTADSFDILASTSSARSYPVVNPHASVNFTYEVSVSTGESGNLSSSLVASDFTFGGISQSLTSGQASVVVFKPLFATISANPSQPVEGQPFTVRVVIRNPASVAISNVALSIPLPSGLQVLNSSGLQVQGKSLLASIPAVGAGANYTVSATLKAALGLTFDMSGSALTFQYGGTKVNGAHISTVVSVGEDVTARYTFPLAIAILVLIASVVYIRRRALSPPSP
jgi:hypothetical protein